MVKKLHDHGIGIQGCFVFGFDNDDESVFERTVEFVDKTKIDLPRYAVVTPFPGTGYLPPAGGRGPAAAQALVAVRRRARRLSAQADESRSGCKKGWNGRGGRAIRWRSMFTRHARLPLSFLPLWVSLNLGYRYYAKHLPTKTGPTVYRDPAYMADARRRRVQRRELRTKAAVAVS